MLSRFSCVRLCATPWKVLDLISKEKKSFFEVAESYSKNDYSIHEIMKKEEELCASFAVVSQTSKITATLHERCLVKMEKVLNFYNCVTYNMLL